MMYNYKNHVLSTTINRNIVFVTISSCILDNKKEKNSWNNNTLDFQIRVSGSARPHGSIVRNYICFWT